MKRTITSLLLILSILLTTNEEYTIWLENDKSETRVFNILIWSTNDNMIVFNDIEGKYGYIKSPEKDTLKEILIKYIKNDLEE